MRTVLGLVSGLLVCLLLTACTVGIVQREDFTPVASATPTPISTPAEAPSPWPTQTSPPPTATQTPTPLPAPTAVVTMPPTATEEGGSGPAILYFRANVEEADPGDTIVLEWESVGATEAILYHIPKSLHMPQSGWDVDTSGSRTVEIGQQERNWVMYYLYVWDEAERGADGSLTISLRCPDPWFFSPAPDVCATAPIVSDAAEQHFERGMMIWVGELDRIYVLYSDVNHPKWQGFNDDWDESQPDRDPSLVAPDGLYQPIRGFGLIWRQNPDVRVRLGWAIDQEAGFSTIVQHTTLYKYNSTYLRARDGNVWHLGPELSSWEKIVTE